MNKNDIKSFLEIVEDTYDIRFCDDGGGYYHISGSPLKINGNDDYVECTIEINDWNDVNWYQPFERGLFISGFSFSRTIEQRNIYVVIPNMKMLKKFIALLSGIYGKSITKVFYDENVYSRFLGE